MSSFPVKHARLHKLEAEQEALRTKLEKRHRKLVQMQTDAADAKGRPVPVKPVYGSLYLRGHRVLLFVLLVPLLFIFGVVFTNHWGGLAGAGWAFCSFWLVVAGARSYPFLRTDAEGVDIRVGGRTTATRMPWSDIAFLEVTRKSLGYGIALKSKRRGQWERCNLDTMNEDDLRRLNRVFNRAMIRRSV